MRWKTQKPEDLRRSRKEKLLRESGLVTRIIKKKRM